MSLTVDMHLVLLVAHKKLIFYKFFMWVYDRIIKHDHIWVNVKQKGINQILYLLKNTTYIYSLQCCLSRTAFAVNYKQQTTSYSCHLCILIYNIYSVQITLEYYFIECTQYVCVSSHSQQESFFPIHVTSVCVCVCVSIDLLCNC